MAGRSSHDLCHASLVLCIGYDVCTLGQVCTVDMGRVPHQYVSIGFFSKHISYLLETVHVTLEIEHMYVM